MKVKIFIVFLLVIIISILELKSGSGKDIDLNRYNNSSGSENDMDYLPIATVMENITDSIGQDTEKTVRNSIDGCVGYIEIPDTIIKLPVMQGNDNEFYLKHNTYGDYDRCGSLFLDYRANAESRNKVIYGHNMGSGRTEMFSKLVDFQSEKYAKQHQYMYWNDNNRNGSDIYKLCAVINFDVAQLSDFDYMQPEFSPDNFESLKAYINKKSVFVLDNIEYTDKLITLSTCNRVYGTNNRLIIIYKLV